MGTNYYMIYDECKECGRYEELHIGKSSGGWCFALKVYPEKRIESLGDWLILLKTNKIKNGYNDIISYNKMMSIITEREGDLSRHTINGTHCTGHGPGTYDYMIGEFS